MGVKLLESKKDFTQKNNHSQNELGTVLLGNESQDTIAKEIIAYMRKDFPTVERFDAMPLTGENGWGKYTILGVGGVSVICTRLGIRGLHVNQKTGFPGKVAVRKKLFPEAKDLPQTTEEIIDYMREDFQTVERFDAMPVTGENGWVSYSIPGVGGAFVICTRLGIRGLSKNQKVGLLGKAVVRKILFPEAEDIPETAEEIIAYMRKDFPTVERFDAMPLTGANGWGNYSIPGVGGAQVICTRLGIRLLHADQKTGSPGKAAVRKKLFPEVKDLPQTTEEIIAYMRKDFQTVKIFNAIPITGENGWVSYSIPGVGGAQVICTRLGITWLNSNEKKSLLGKAAARKILFPEAEDIPETVEEIIAYMRKDFQTVEKFDAIPLTGANGWVSYSIPGVGGAGVICTRLGIVGLGKNGKTGFPGKAAVRKILFPEAEDIPEAVEEIIAYMRKDFQTVERFDAMSIWGDDGWRKYTIPGVGGVGVICTRLGIVGLNSNQKKNGLGKTAVRKVLFPEAEELLSAERQEQLLEGLLTGTELQKIIGVLGPEVAKDILYIQDPRTKKIDVEVVNSGISDYLGDFVSQFVLFDDLFWRIIPKFLENISIQEALLETLKQDMVNKYVAIKRNNPQQDDKVISDMYISDLYNQVQDIQNPLLKNILMYLQKFIAQIHAFEKPANIIDFIEDAREIPDFGQKINIAELKNKKRLLIADEMGMGKSASVILAKENLGLKRALIIAPSNVISTWEGYLSDAPDKKGLFRKGQAPRVVEIINNNDFISAVDADYILVSQEKLNNRNSKLLKTLSCEMLVVDEQHKLKNAHGIRANNLVDIIQDVLPVDSYLALLSGTPSPNKVSDITVALKLLYPENPVIANMSLSELKLSIIKGDFGNLRGLLVKKMQSKRTINSIITLPTLEESTEFVELSDKQQKVYESILEEEELTSTEKLQLFWKFLHNPTMIELLPELGCAKLEALSKKINSKLQGGKNKIVVFVNQGISNVIVGDEKDTILSKMHLPSDVKITALHGQEPINGGTTRKQRRDALIESFNTSSTREVLFVSGKVGDVGINLTGGDAIIHYDEPWTVSDKNQQIKRIQRSGNVNETVDHDTLLVSHTIDEGIHQYILEKQKIIDKLMYGIPLNEIEKDILIKSEKGGDNPENNRYLAEYYMSIIQRLNQHFAYLKDIGTANYQEYLKVHALEYAEYYTKLGGKSYQANVNRVSGEIVSCIVDEKGITIPMIIDIASGPCMLKSHIKDSLQKNIISIDGNQNHFTPDMENCLVAPMNKIPVQDNSFDFAHIGLAFQDTSLLFSKKNYDRLETLLELNRILKIGGHAIIQLPYGNDFKNFEEFKSFVEVLGFSVVEKYTGESQYKNIYSARTITLQKQFVSDWSRDEIIAEAMIFRNGLKIQQSVKRLLGTRNIITQFVLGNEKYTIHLNEQDNKILGEEQTALQDIRDLIHTYGSIKAIPLDIIKEKDYIWFSYKPGKYKILKELSENHGLVEYKE